MNETVEWPPSGLEDVQDCPWCLSQGRTLLYPDLTDITFGTAPGKWNFYKCDSCGSGYLNPRPTQVSIHLAYKKYYTHHDEYQRSKLDPSTFFTKLRLALINGYRNKVFNACFRPAWSVGYFTTLMRPRTAEIVLDDMRYIPQRPIGKAPKLLDVGCGNGGFLKLAANGGWQACGCDPDPEAAGLVVKEDNVDIRTGSASVFLDEAGTFDIITTSHVIEHVHNPTRELEVMYTLLSSGGMLYLDTPNIDSFGHSFWRQYWLGLDAPRHLSLPTKDMLSTSLSRLGFTDIKFIRRPQVWKSLSVMSARQELGKKYRDSSDDHKLRLPSKYTVTDENLEMLTLTCLKP